MEVFYLEEIEEEHTKLSRLRELILVGLPKMTAIWKGNLSAARLENLKMMKVKECGKLKNLFSKALAKKVHQLVHLAVMNCDTMAEIISNEQAEMEQEAVEIVVSSNMPSPMFFKNLQKLTISKCKKMKSILALRLVRGLEQLEELVIASCNQMEEIISKGEEEEEENIDDKNMLPRLKILALQNLPRLCTLYKGALLLNWPSLEELQVWNCLELKTLPLDLHGAPKLRKFKGQVEWFENLEWKYEITKTRLQPLLTEEYVL
ncbi:hypothetical protein L1049_001230 [Liquidambar formosana]|uniref:Disease resistance protein At4g27190-like leucine-rich repeats domain-containing protein n=1 Tax=Liquidambar formosana TaxID=63359 RepID=A0AAP0NBZ6_LIQFO